MTTSLLERVTRRFSRLLGRKPKLPEVPDAISQAQALIANILSDALRKNVTEIRIAFGLTWTVRDHTIARGLAETCEVRYGVGETSRVVMRPPPKMSADIVEAVARRLMRDYRPNGPDTDPVEFTFEHPPAFEGGHVSTTRIRVSMEQETGAAVLVLRLV